MVAFKSGSMAPVEKLCGAAIRGTPSPKRGIVFMAFVAALKVPNGRYPLTVLFDDIVVTFEAPMVSG